MDKTKKADDLVVIDMREFRSPLPSILHSNGIKIHPITITIGDYILTPNICVERKSVSDLFSSFASGRLYTQIENMNRFFKHPTLLIEFDEKKAFCLCSPSDLSEQIKPTSIHARMVLLTRTFPSMRILWSKSPHTTVGIFRALKAKEPQPDVALVSSYGNEEGVDTLNENVGEENTNLAKEMLLRMPGFTFSKNHYLIIKNIHAFSLFFKCRCL